MRSLFVSLLILSFLFLVAGVLPAEPEKDKDKESGDEVEKEDEAPTDPLAEYIAQLGSPDRGKRLEAIDILSAAGDESLPHLEKHLADEEAWWDFFTVPIILAKIDTEKSWEFFVEHLEKWETDSYYNYTWRALDVVRDLHKRKLQPLLRRIVDKAEVETSVKAELVLDTFEFEPIDPELLKKLLAADTAGSEADFREAWKPVDLSDKRKRIVEHGLEFAGQLLDDEKIARIALPFAGFTAVHEAKQKGFFLDKRLKFKVDKKSEITAEEIAAGHYFGDYRTRKKGTPGHWVWVSYAEDENGKVPQPTAWMNPAYICAPLPFELREYDDSDVKRGKPKSTGRVTLESKVRLILDDIEILNVVGDWDHADKVMDDLKIKYTRLIISEFKKTLKQKKPPDADRRENRGTRGKPLWLDPQKHLIIFNCASGWAMPLQEKKAFRDFVAAGGYILSTDWAIEITGKIFPEYAVVDQKNSLSEEWNKVKIVWRQRAHPLLRDVDGLRERHDWWFEVQSYVPIVMSRKVKTLVTCPSLDNIPVVITWTYGGDLTHAEEGYHYPGRVLHYVSHLEAQNLRGTETEKKGIYNLQMLFVNFILLKQDEYSKWQKAELEKAKKKPKKPPKE